MSGYHYTIEKMKKIISMEEEKEKIIEIMKEEMPGDLDSFTNYQRCKRESTIFEKLIFLFFDNSILCKLEISNQLLPIDIGQIHYNDLIRTDKLPIVRIYEYLKKLDLNEESFLQKEEIDIMYALRKRESDYEWNALELFETIFERKKSIQTKIIDPIPERKLII